MLLEFIFDAHVVEPATGAKVAPSKLPDSHEFSEEPLETYFDAELADAGVQGGSIRYFKEQGQPRICVTYRAPDDLGDEIVDVLERQTVAQLMDGLGESGFDFSADANMFTVYANVEVPVQINRVKGRRKARGSSKIAIAARDGNYQALASALEKSRSDIERLHQGFTPLQLAIWGGHTKAVEMLLAAGADVNGKNVLGDMALEYGAKVNSIDDSVSHAITTLLLASGADPSRVDGRGLTAADYAEDRGKLHTAQLLRSIATGPAE